VRCDSFRVLRVLFMMFATHSSSYRHGKTVLKCAMARNTLDVAKYLAGIGAPYE
jgi:hypothetical protein